MPLTRRARLDAAAFERAFEAHGRAIYRYAYGRVGPDIAEEVLSDTFAVAWRSRDGFEDSQDRLQPWLIGIATNVIARHRRAEQRWLQMGADAARVLADPDGGQDDLAATDARIDSAARARAVGAALDGLPRRERDVLIMHILSEMSYEDIAAALGIPLGTVRSRISRGRGRLVGRLGEGGLR